MITVYPQTKVMLSDLKIDLNRFKKFLDPHIGDSIFANDADGMSLRTASNGEVISIQYFPQTKDNHLRCSPAPQAGDARKFDEYSNLPFSDEKARLDNFAIYLQKDEPTFKGYIVVYAGQRVRSGTAQVRAKRARDYLIKVRGIEAARIATIGCRENLESNSVRCRAPSRRPVRLHVATSSFDFRELRCKRHEKLKIRVNRPQPRAALDTNTSRPYSLPFRTFGLKHPKSNVQLVL